MSKYFAIFFLIGVCIFAHSCRAQKEKPSAQIPAIIEDKKNRTAIQEKIDSRLLQAMRERAGKKIKGTDMSPVDVGADGQGNITVDIDASVTDTLLANIKSLNGIILSSFKQFNAIRARINFSNIEKIAALKGVKFIQPAAQAQTNGLVKPGEASVRP